MRRTYLGPLVIAWSLVTAPLCGATPPRADVQTWTTFVSPIGPEIQLFILKSSSEHLAVRAAMQIPTLQPSSCDRVKAVTVRKALYANSEFMREDGSATSADAPPGTQWIHRAFVTGFGDSGKGCIVRLDVALLGDSGSRYLKLDVTIPAKPPRYLASPIEETHVAPAVDFVVESDHSRNSVIARVRVRNDLGHPVRYAITDRSLKCPASVVATLLDPYSPVAPRLDTGPYEVKSGEFGVFVMSVRLLAGDRLDKCELNITLAIDRGDFVVMPQSKIVVPLHATQSFALD